MSAARKALETGEVGIVLPYVPKDREDEISDAFEAVYEVRGQGPEVREVADLHFFETVVRVHRAGEGAPYEGLKPAGPDHGPVIPVAERAIETGTADELVGLLTERVEDEIRGRFDRVIELKAGADGDIDANRAYVEAMLDLQVWSHSLYQATMASAHEHGQSHAH